MAVRIYPMGYEYMDPVGPSSTAGGGVIIDDGAVTPPYVDRPDQQRMDYQLNTSLRRWMTAPREELQAIAPPLPPVPPVYGYRTEQMTIEDVFSNNFTAYRPRPGENMSGSLRNSMSAANPIG
jgi:hypothetical protein